MLNRISTTPIFIYAFALALSLFSPLVSVLVYALVPIVFIVRAVMPLHRHGRD